MRYWATIPEEKRTNFALYITITPPFSKGNRVAVGDAWNCCVYAPGNTCLDDWRGVRLRAFAATLRSVLTGRRPAFSNPHTLQQVQFNQPREQIGKIRSLILVLSIKAHVICMVGAIFMNTYRSEQHRHRPRTLCHLD